MKRISSLMFALVLTTLSLPSLADDAATQTAVAGATQSAVADQELDGLKARLKVLYPASRFDSVARSQIEGLFELVAGNNLFYTEKTGKYFVFGSIYNMATQQDLSADRRAQISKIDISTLPLNDAIKIVHGKGTHTIYVFSDPECPFCKRAEHALQDADDMTMYVFLMPIAQLHPESAKISESIWCASDKAAAWTNYMLKGIAPKDKTCDNPILRNLQLAKGFQIIGTPTFIREDGSIKAGAPTKEQIPSFLNKE